MAWISKNAFLSQAEMENNALEFTQLGVEQYGWSLNGIAGILGNMESESTINPGIWESLDAYNYSNGFGLVQWTPATKYIDWAGADWENPAKEVERIDYESKNGIQWFYNIDAPQVWLPPSPPITLEQLLKDETTDPQTLALMFLAYYEHPADIYQPNRATQAKLWYEFISGHSWKKRVKPWIVSGRRAGGAAIRRQRILKY